MNDLDLCLEVVSRSRQPLRYIWRWISRKPLEVELGSKRPPIGNGIWAIEWSRDRWRHVTVKGQTRDPNTLRAQNLENYLSYWLQIWQAALYWECHNNFPERGRGLGHATPAIFGIRSNISLKLLELDTSNLIHGLVWAMPSRRTNDLPWKWAWPRSRDPYNFWQYGRLS